jgi:hypothetical protein
MNTNKVMFSMIFNDGPFNKDLYLLERCLFLTIKNLIHLWF